MRLQFVLRARVRLRWLLANCIGALMALITLGTAATNTLSAIKWSQATSTADIAAMNALFDNIVDGTKPVIFQSQTFPPKAQISHGHLIVPERGVSIRLFVNDYIGVDPSRGHWVLISRAAADSASWVHS